MKKVLFVLLLAFLPLMAFADAVFIDGIYYNLIEKGKAAEVAFNPNKYSGDVVIPETVFYEDVSYDVTTISGGAFSYCTDLTSVTIPNSVTSIRNYAFNNCSGLVSIDIPNSVVAIGDDAFAYCNGLTSLVIPNSVTTIGSWAFYSCSNLISILIPNSVTFIGEGAFQDCRSLASFVIPNKLTTIENQLFIGCSSLTSVTIPSSVTSIGRYAFGCCRSLTSITIPNGVFSIGDRAFYMCNSLSSVNIPNIATVGELMFYECTSLTSINIPNSVTKIKENAFANCSNLATVTIGKNVQTIDNNAFANCSELKDVYCYAENVPTTTTNVFDGSFIEYATLHVPSVSIDSYKSTSPWNRFQNIVSAYAIVEICDICYRIFFQTNTAEIVNSSNKSVVEVNILEKVVYDGISYDVTSIGEDAFFGFRNLVTVNIPQSVISIGQSAFYGCLNLDSITIPNSVQDIGNSAFAGCSALSHVKLSYGLTSIGWYTFAGCWALEEIIIPPLVDCIRESAFYNTKLKTVKVLPVEPPVVQNNAFDNYESISLKVPEVVLETYKSTEPWNKFGNINVWEEAHMLQYQLDNEIYKTHVLLEGDAITPEPIEPREGYTFSGWIGLPESMPNHDVIVTGSFIANKYKLTYILDGELYTSYEVECGATITPEPSPEKEGYSFSGWSEIPETMPAHDVTVYGSFTINKYKLTYLVDNQVYKTFDVEYGVSITPEPAPTKEGHTFSGWSGIPERMPAHDVTVTGSFTVNQYMLTYMVDGVVYKNQKLDYGTTITPEPAPTKEGYTFSGWSEIPETMPAHDVIVNGTFTINKYKLTYLVDNQVYKSLDVEYGAAITAEPAPTKEGHTFSGWSGIPERMPAHDVTVIGTFTVNKYVLLYILDGQEYKTIEVDYGTTITPEPDPVKEGYTFSGWSSIPKTMPARTVIITGTFTINNYKLTYLLNGEEYKQQTITYGTPITPEPAIEREGHTFSGWSEIPATMPAHDVTVTGTLTVNKYVLAYILDGREYKTLELDYGTVITPEPDPEKDGYTFSGWIGLPETMPARFVIVTGTFSINSYLLTYMIDDDVYKQVKYEYGAAITPEPQPDGDYKSFAWVGVPETMPAHDVTVTAVYETGITDLLMMAEQGLLRIYSPNGKLLSRPQKGLNIIVMPDGTVHKIVVK